MENWHKARTDHALAITKACEPFVDSGLLRIPLPSGDIEHAYYKFYVFVVPEALKPDWTRDRIVNEISHYGVPCFQGSCSEVYLEKAFDGTGFRPTERLPVAKALGETSLMFLVHPTLTADEIKQTCEAIKVVMNLALR